VGYFEDLVRQIRDLHLADMVTSLKLRRELIYRRLFPGTGLSLEERQELRAEKDRVNRLFFFLNYGLKYQKMPTGANGKDREAYRLLLHALVEKGGVRRSLLETWKDWPEARKRTNRPTLLRE